MDCSVEPTRHAGVWNITTTDFFFPLVEDPYLQGRIGCCNVLSDLYAMGVTDCDRCAPPHALCPCSHAPALTPLLPRLSAQNKSPRFRLTSLTPPPHSPSPPLTRAVLLPQHAHARRRLPRHARRLSPRVHWPHDARLQRRRCFRWHKGFYAFPEQHNSSPVVLTCSCQGGRRPNCPKPVANHRRRCSGNRVGFRIHFA